MTDSDEKLENQIQPLNPFISAGERWKEAIIASTKHKIPTQKWVLFLTAVQNKYPIASKFAPTEHGVQDETGRSIVLRDGSSTDIAERLIAAAESPTWEEAEHTSRRGLDRWGQLPSLNAPDHLIATTEAPVQSLPPAVERSSYSVLDTNLKNFLANLLDIQIPAVKIYTNRAADALTQQYGADALTDQDKIFFRAGKFSPRDVRGVALLAHELTHAAQARLEPRTVPIGMRSQTPENLERQALVNEAKVLQHFSSASSTNQYSPRSHSGSALWMQQLQTPSHSILTKASQTSPAIKFEHSPPSSRLYENPSQKYSGGTVKSHNGPHGFQIQSGQLQAASSDREINLPTPESPSLSTPQLSEQLLRQVKEEVYQDLMNRIRIEFERGG